MGRRGGGWTLLAALTRRSAGETRVKAETPRLVGENTDSAAREGDCTVRAAVAGAGYEGGGGGGSEPCECTSNP